MKLDAAVPILSPTPGRGFGARKRLTTTVNGTPIDRDVAAHMTALDFLRDALGLKGAKECCAVGECGACTVIVDGQPVNSCLMLAVELQGKTVETIEAQAAGQQLSTVQHAFLKCGAVQCGFCIPGMVMSAEALHREAPDADEAQVREALSGNLCRCGGYNRMFDAMRDVAGTPVHLKTEDPTKGASIGQDISRLGGVERVTGAQEFVGDVVLDGMTHAKLVTLDVGRARIMGIDASAALSVPGVIDVISAADLPDPVRRFGPFDKDRPPIAIDETRYHGEPVALVIAESRDIAAYAATLVCVNHEALPVVTTIEDALAEDAPLVQPPELRGDDPLAQSNVLKSMEYGWGDATGTNADLVIENTYRFPMVTHFAIEPHGYIADARDDRMTIWSPVQHPYVLQKVMAELFDLPLGAVRVLAPDPGGGFGGKQMPKFEPLLAIASRKVGRPVRLVLSLEETFQAVRRAGARVHIRSGFSKDGDLLFHDIQSDYQAGAYGDVVTRVTAKGNYLGCGPYRVPNARIRARSILTHTTPSCAFRGFGTPQVNWAVESQINEAARRLGIDGLDIRRRNVSDKGDQVVQGDVPADGHWLQSLEKAAEILEWDTPKASGRGRGIAVGIKAGATAGLSNATIRLLGDGSILVFAGTSDMGQGARTIFAQIAADALGAPYARVSVIMGDTDKVPYDMQTSASRSTVFMGNAITRACEDLQQQVLDLAHELTGEEVHLEGCNIHLPDGPVPIFDFVQNNLGAQGELIGHGRMHLGGIKGHPLGGAPAFFEFNCTAFEVSVDETTGEVTVHKHVTVGDVGKALNPLQVEMQDEGAAIMGLGHSLYEQMLYEPETGRMLNPGAIDYRIVTSKDMPERLATGMIENEDGPGPKGAKGISEGAILCTAPALGAAIADATGLVLKDLPLTPERIWRGLQNSQKRDGRSDMNAATKTMDALVLNGPRDFEVREVPVPDAEGDEVLCKVDTTFICGTDPHIIAGDFPGFWPPAFPFTPGHEWSGTVVKAGAKAAALGWAEGDRVCAISHVGCGYCDNCMKGRYNICLNYGELDKGHRQHGHITPGAYAQYMTASVKSLYKIPDDMDLEYAACVDPLSIALYTVNRSRMEPGDDVLITGTGPQGLMALLCAKALGAGRIFIAGSGERLALAEELGGIPINYRDNDINEAVRAQTNGRGVARVLECAGTAAALNAACHAAAKGGVVSLIGIPHSDPTLPIKRMVLDEVELVGNRANPNTAIPAIALMQEGRVDLKPLMSHSFPLKDFATALDMYEGRKDGSMKIAIKPN